MAKRLKRPKRVFRVRWETEIMAANHEEAALKAGMFFRLRRPKDQLCEVQEITDVGTTGEIEPFGEWHEEAI
jgi:hypothetical protein